MRRKKNDPRRLHNEKVAQAVAEHKDYLYLEDLTRVLKLLNYNIEDAPSNHEPWLVITGHGIKGFVYDETVFADHKDCYDKLRKCPIQLPLPRNERQLEYLISRLEYMGTKEAFKMSNEYNYVTEDEYPMR